MTTLGGAEALRRGAGDSVIGVSDGRCQEPSAGPLLWAGGVTGVADRWRDNRCPGRRGKHWSHGEVESSIAGGASAGITGGRSQALPEGATVSRAGKGERRCDQGGRATIYGRREEALSRGRAPALPEAATAGVTGEGER